MLTVAILEILVEFIVILSKLDMLCLIIDNVGEMNNADFGHKLIFYISMHTGRFLLIN